MRLGTNGILINQFNQILLIQRNDTRTYSLPGGGIETGELASTNIAREIQEETGIIAQPVRLVSLSFWALPPAGFLAFTFRCLQRGGELQTSAESPRVGFYPVNDLPRPMLSISRDRVKQGVAHTGGPVDWWIIPNTRGTRFGRFLLFNVVHPWLNLRRKMQKQPDFIPPPSWGISVCVVIQNEAGAVYHLAEDSGWVLPGGGISGLRAPWEAAQQLAKSQTGLSVHLNDVSGVYVAAGQAKAAIVFTATIATAVPAGTAPREAAPPGSWLPPAVALNEEQAPHHLYLREALAPDRLTTNFKHLPAS